MIWVRNDSIIQVANKINIPKEEKGTKLGVVRKTIWWAQDYLSKYFKAKTET